MLVLHALWSSRLHIWAEDPEAAGPGRPNEHPFAASDERLESAIDVPSEFADVVLLLPSGPRGPVPSPELRRLGVDGPSPRRPRLQPWRVPALAFEPDAAIDVLLRKPACAGDSFRALARAAHIALDIVARGRVLPGIVAGEARWLPVPVAQDDAAVAALAASLPPVCRAVLKDAEPPAIDIVNEAVAALVDAVTRSALCGRRLAPPRRGRPTVTEAFLAALTSDDPRVDGDTAKLAQVLDEWRGSGVRTSGPLRTCFRLTPPDDDTDATWRVEFLLRSTEDPSLLVEAADVWRARRTLKVLHHTYEHPQERLLTDLGHAMRLYPDLETALGTARPVELATDAEGAVRFLEVAPLLEASGFDVLVPSWWGSPSSRLGVRVRAKVKRDASATSSGLLGMAGLADYRYEIALGDGSLSERQLRELARLKAPLVRVRGKWVMLRPGEAAEALELLRRSAEGSMTAADVLRAGLGLAPDVGTLPVVGVEADGWLGELLSSDLKIEPVATPDGFGGTLRPYQERGLGWLTFLDRVGLGACLADDMGLGKTPTLLSLLVAERRGRKRPKPTLLVCPMSVVGNWQREAERFAPKLKVHAHHGTERTAAFAKAVKRADLVITTYGLAARDRELLSGVEWGRVVLDEAQNIKNASSKQAQAVRSIRAPRRVALTGTPVENRLSELWSIMDFANPGLLGSAKGFRERFAVPIERYGDEDAAGLLRRVTGPFVLRRLKTDRTIITDLPDKIEMKVFCNLTREQATLYQAVVDDMLEKVESSDGIERKGLVLATMLRLKQVCNHPAHFLADGSSLPGRSGKLARLEEILDEAVASGDRALCFSQFAEMGHMLRTHLEGRFGFAAPFLHGGIAKRARDEMVARFQSGDGPPVLLVSLKAGGVGLNLTAAGHVVHFDRWWNPAVEDQATDRAFRIGQTRNVQVRKFVCVGTLEERIDRMIEDKRALAERIVGTGEGWLTELSTDALRELVALSSDAVAEG